ncbi:MAG: hypothetical protein ABFD54_16550 [Armatimonadota bacterium]|nr:hypothetical protein [bacterium]
MAMRVRRQAVYAALALVLSTMCASAAWGVYERNFINPEDFGLGVRDGINFAYEIGGVGLNRCTNYVPFLWVPSPSSGTVSRIDARTGAEVARYKMGKKGDRWTPCAVATDSGGNAYIACSCPGGKGKIVRILAFPTVDVNGDGHVYTSGDYDSNNQITPIEILPWGLDESVSLVGEVGDVGSSPSSILFDKQGYLWVALTGECAVARVNCITGVTTLRVTVEGSPQWMALGLNNSLWVLSGTQHVLNKVGMITGTLDDVYRMDDCAPAGMCMDEQNRLWIGDLNGGLLAFDTIDFGWTRFATPTGAGLSSVTIDTFGDVWAACPGLAGVAQFSGTDGSYVGMAQVGRIPSSVCTDIDGYLWVLRDGCDTAVRIDPRNGQTVLQACAGERPSCNTSFAASTVREGILPEGTWRAVLNSNIPGAGWGKITWDALEAGGSIKVEARTADAPDMLAMSSFMPVTKGMRFDAPEGQYMELKVTFKSNGDASPILRSMHVEGINLAPKLDKAMPTVANIWKIDHTMESVGITGVRDPEGDPFEVTITSVKQNEPVIGLGQDDKAPDAIGVGSASVWLRGEFDPGTDDNPGKGRTYEVTYKAVDSYGASSVGKVKVFVPPTLLTKDVPLVGTLKFDSTKEPASNICETASPNG